jgi:hypothetical protein
MDETSISPEPVIIEQDEGSEIHIQAATQSGSRQLDIRVWRRGPAGFAPSRNALTIQYSDVPAMRDGMQQLIEESAGGTQAVRIVLEKQEGRRLRAETEPFGTRYLAKLVFWQRVRDSWRPVDDGLMIAADRVDAIRTIMERFVPWLEAGVDSEGEGTGDALQHHIAHRWPNPGADWLSVEPGKLIFHPRGVRVTCTVREHEGAHLLRLHQWRREESIWVPANCSIDLDIVQLDTILNRIREIDTGTVPESSASRSEEREQIRVAAPDSATLTIQHRTFDEDRSTCTISIPREEMSRFGRALLQSGSILARSLSPEERTRLEEMQEARHAVAEYEAEATPDSSLSTSGVADSTGAGHTSIRDMILNTIATPTAPPRHQERERPRRHDVPPTYDEQDEDEFQAEEPSEEFEPFVELEPSYVPVQDIQLDHHRVHISVRPGEDGRLSLQWSGKSIALPVSRLDELVSDLRDLYYNALRGRRGLPITVAMEPPVTISVLHHGAQLYFALAQETEGSGTHLSFPANEVPVFLDAARAALAALGEEREG